MGPTGHPSEKGIATKIEGQIHSRISPWLFFFPEMFTCICGAFHRDRIISLHIPINAV